VSYSNYLGYSITCKHDDYDDDDDDDDGDKEQFYSASSRVNMIQGDITQSNKAIHL